MSGYVVIQRNPHSGTHRRSHVLLDLIAGLKRAGLKPRLFSNRSRLDEFVLRHQTAGDLVAMVAAGGDGTVDDLLNRHPELPLAILPLGTENLLARYLGFRLDGSWLAKIIALGHVREMDLARANGRLFCTVASAGFDASIVRDVHSRRSGHANRWSLFFLVSQTSVLVSFSRYGRDRALFAGSGETFRYAIVCQQCPSLRHATAGWSGWR